MLPLHRLERLRTFGVVAHVDAGKTTLTERILHATGCIHRPGSVDDGNTVTDHDPREQRRGITIGAATVTATHRDHTLSLVDTPGHVDFGIEVERSLRVLDGAIVVLDAVAGVEPQTETVWALADKRELPRIVFVNKIDRAGASFEGAVRALEDRFGVIALPVVVPSASGASLLDLVNLLEVEAGDRSSDRARPLPASHRDVAERARAKLVETLATLDDRILGPFVDGAVVGPDLLRAALRSATVDRKAVVVLSGSAKLGLGVSTLLDAIVDLMPSPLDRGCNPDPSAPLRAFCFKSAHDDFGQRTFVRVFEGTLQKGDAVLAVRSGKRVRVGRLVRLFADATRDIDAAGPGEIAAVLGLPLVTGETLCHPDRAVSMEGLEVPDAVVTVALEPRTTEARSKLGEALRRIVSDDPSLRLSGDPETGQTLLSGLGELHLEVTLEKLRGDFGVEVRTSEPRVAYRETVTASGEAEVKHVRRTGGPGQYGHVRLRVEPRPRGAGWAFVDATVGGVIPRQFVPVVEAGAKEAAAAGVVEGHPVHDVLVTLLDGSAHSHDSNEMAFATAARRAFQEAAALASPVVLEPVMRIEIAVPEVCVGDVLGDLAARRGAVEGLETRGARNVVRGRAPLAELVGYVTSLRSRTKGRGSASITLDGYEVVPPGAKRSRTE